MSEQDSVCLCFVFLVQVCWCHSNAVAIAHTDNEERESVDLSKVPFDQIVKGAKKADGSFLSGYAPGNFMKVYSVWARWEQSPKIFTLARIFNRMTGAECEVERTALLKCLPTAQAALLQGTTHLRCTHRSRSHVWILPTWHRQHRRD